MQPRSKWWILTIIVLFLLSFMYAFQPLRLKPKPTDVNSTFRYTFNPPLVQDDSQLVAKAQEIDQYLQSKGLGEQVDRVDFKEKNVLEIATFAFDETQARSDQQKLLSTLAQKYPGATAMAMPDQEQREQPLSVLGPLALYAPKPQVKLGLDLIGGAHVVLRALPETTLTFTTPEDHPMVKMATPTPAAATPPAAAAKPTVEASITSDVLADRVRNLLVKGGARVEGTNDLQVNFPAPYMMVVKTRAENAATATKQKDMITAFLQDTLRGTTVTAAEPSSVFLAKETADKVKNIIERRLYEMSEIREPIMQTQGVDRIIVELPGVSEPERVVSILKSTAALEFVLIPDRYEATNAAEDDYSDWRDKQTGQTVPWERVLAEARAAATDPKYSFKGGDLKSASEVNPDQQAPGSWVVSFELRDDRKQAFREFTRRSVGKNMAIVLDDKAQMAPVIKSEIPGSGIIEGRFTAQQAGDLKLLLNAGALPVPLEIAENRTISATLGSYAIQRSMLAGAIGLSLVVVFMIVFYRLPGLLADVALALYVLIVLAVLTFTKTTLTLPGIGGIILSIGMAVDANILIFERLKEEIWAGKSIRAAIDAGFERAWTAILDTNVNSMIVAAVLYFLGTSSIKSFAVALFVGVVCSLFTAVTVSRWMVTMVGQSKLGQRLHLFGVHQEPA